MATGPEETGTGSRESRRSWKISAGSELRLPGPAGSWELALTSMQHSLKFVMKLKEEFVCPICRGVVLNPQQNSCGHIYCSLCLQGLLETLSSPVCPVDGAVIIPAEVFQDNCCKREISSLEVYCTNSPGCTAVVTLQRLQDHLSLCQHEWPQCTDPACRAALQRTFLQEHLSHSCPHGSAHGQQRHQLGLVKDQREKVKLHEDAALNHHMKLLLRSNIKLEKQVEALQQEALLRQQQADRLQSDIRPWEEQSSRQEQTIASAQRTLSRHEDVLSSVQLEVQQVCLGFGPGLEDLEQLRSSLDAVLQEVSAAESLREHLGALEENLMCHSGLLDLHAAQLSCNTENLQELQATAYDGKLIWKIKDFGKRREAEVKGQPPCLSSVPFHAGRCGYKMAVKAYVNGDGDGRGTHLSLYVVLMPGDFDALLPWPFGQTVTLSVLDQSGARKHRSLSFRPEPTSNSFQRPDGDSISNVASGFSRFVPLSKLEAPPSSVFVRDDALFVKVRVDLAGLEDV